MHIHLKTLPRLANGSFQDPRLHLVTGHFCDSRKVFTWSKREGFDRFHEQSEFDCRIAETVLRGSWVGAGCYS